MKFLNSFLEYSTDAPKLDTIEIDTNNYKIVITTKAGKKTNEYTLIFDNNTDYLHSKDKYKINDIYNDEKIIGIRKGKIKSRLSTNK